MTRKNTKHMEITLGMWTPSWHLFLLLSLILPFLWSQSLSIVSLLCLWNFSEWKPIVKYASFVLSSCSHSEVTCISDASFHSNILFILQINGTLLLT
jgi:hypothetical protein